MRRIKKIMRQSRKPKKSAKNIKGEQQFSEDPDELQLLDECNSKWAEAWKAAAERLAELDVFVFEPGEQDEKLVKKLGRR
jgi:hypothetical protein